MRRSSSIENIESGFEKSGIVPINANRLLSSNFTQETHRNNNDLLRNYCLNTENALIELFEKENDRQPTEQDITINL